MYREKGTNYELTKKLTKFSEQYYCGQNGNKYTKRIIIVNIITIILIQIEVINFFFFVFLLMEYFHIILKRATDNNF